MYIFLILIAVVLIGGVFYSAVDDIKNDYN